MQTEGQAFRKAIEETLKADTILSRVLLGGWHFDIAPTETPEPYAVFTITPFPESKGNGGRRVLIMPLVRVRVYASGISSSVRTKADIAARQIDRLLLSLSVTVNDDTDPILTPDDAFKVEPFRRESGDNGAQTQSWGDSDTRIGGDYRGYGYYVNC
jgi:hypothetical protein